MLSLEQWRVLPVGSECHSHREIYLTGTKDRGVHTPRSLTSTLSIRLQTRSKALKTCINKSASSWFRVGNVLCY